MAIVLSNSEDINLLFFLVKIAITISMIAVLLLLIFELRLRNIEKRLYLKKKPLAPRLKRSQPKQKSLVTTQVTTQIGSRNQPSNLVANYQRSPMTRVINESFKVKPRAKNSGKNSTRNPAKNLTKTLIKPSKRNDHGQSLWLFAIAIASITAVLIALMQFGNSLISPEISTFIWFFIGVLLVVSASFIKVA